jgi:hypothetical protein
MDVVTRSRARATTREVSASGDCPVPMGFWAFLRSPPTTPLSGSHCTTGPGPSHSSSNKSQSNLTRVGKKTNTHNSHNSILLLNNLRQQTPSNHMSLNEQPNYMYLYPIYSSYPSVSITNFYPSSIVFIHNEASFGIMPSALRINA